MLRNCINEMDPFGYCVVVKVDKLNKTKPSSLQVEDDTNFAKLFLKLEF